MMERVYIETTIVSYLTAWPGRDLIVAGHQELTREWWVNERANYELCISQLVVQEAADGDPQAAKARLDQLAGLAMLAVNDAAVSLAEQLVQAGALPQRAQNDALHVAIAAVYRVKYLLTWNCRHLANATMRTHIETVCSQYGYKAPIICTPEELMEPKP